MSLCLSSPAIQENRVATVQCLSGTGSLRVGGEFLAKHYHEVLNFLSSYIKLFYSDQGGNYQNNYALFPITSKFQLNFKGVRKVYWGHIMITLSVAVII